MSNEQNLVSAGEEVIIREKMFTKFTVSDLILNH